MLTRICLAAASAAALLAGPGSSSVVAQAAESFAVPNNGPGPLPLGTIAGESYRRLVIRNATFISGRGTPGSNRAMPPEGPVDIVIEGNTIVDVVLMDPVNAAGYGPSFRRPTGDKVIDAAGKYVIPGLVEMHAHLPPTRSGFGPRGLDLAYRLYLGHGVTTVRDAGAGAGPRPISWWPPVWCSASDGRCRSGAGMWGTRPTRRGPWSASSRRWVPTA
jgi:hypothetical protein